ncbi:MAG TPA: DoxX family protein [Saprospirales bacterium]|nr:DoxX family protein [Saprospirales bacterium]
MESFISNLPSVFISTFFSVLFLQSGLDKVLNYQANFAYFKDHFKHSPLAGTVGILMPLITLLETATGVISAISLLQWLVQGSSILYTYSLALSGISLLSLFLGQRLAKDYGGAASLVPYFLVMLAGFWLYKS